MKNKIKKVVMIIVLVNLGVNVNALPIGKKLKVAVVEFETRNKVNFENSKFIISEWLVNELVKTKKYDLQERILIKKILEEKNLQQVGVIDSSKASEIGKLFGVDAIVTGTIMYIDEKISISARLINVNSGKIIYSGVLDQPNMTKIRENMYYLANELAGINRGNAEILKEIENKGTQLDLMVGAGVGYNNSSTTFFRQDGIYVTNGFGISESSSSAASFGAILNTGIRYNSAKLLAWVSGTPVGGLKSFELGVGRYLNHWFGIGILGGQTFDNLIDYVQVSYAHVGVFIRPRYNASIGFSFGGTFVGSVETEGQQEIRISKPYFQFPRNFSVTAQYKIRFNNNYGLKLDINLFARFIVVHMGSLASQLPVDYKFPNKDYIYENGQFIMGVYHSFGI